MGENIRIARLLKHLYKLLDKNTDINIPIFVYNFENKQKLKERLIDSYNRFLEFGTFLNYNVF